MEDKRSKGVLVFIITIAVLSSNFVWAQKDISDLGIIQHPIAWGYWPAQERIIDTIIIHSSFNPRAKDKYSLTALLKIYKRFWVSPHYLILRDGSIYQLVAEKDIANHAGRSHLPDPPYTKNVSLFSIGIELANSKKEPPTENQYLALAELIKNIKSRYTIMHILGHSDITKRKTDPWGLDWDKLNKLL